MFSNAVSLYEIPLPPPPLTDLLGAKPIPPPPLLLPPHIRSFIQAFQTNFPSLQPAMCLTLLRPLGRVSSVITLQFFKHFELGKYILESGNVSIFGELPGGQNVHSPMLGLVAHSWD